MHLVPIVGLSSVTIVFNTLVGKVENNWKGAVVGRV